MPAPKVFLSSTFLEFEVERRKLHRVLTRVLSVACVLAEYLTSESRNLEDALRKCIDESDVVVLLLGLRYGSLSENISWTHKEVRYAYNQGKKILPYFKEQEVPSTMNDIDVHNETELKKFRKFIRENITPSIPRFSEIEELVALVVRDVLHVKQATEREIFEEGFE
jgi:nucleoside 2-deoxyribosyltransferase